MPRKRADSADLIVTLRPAPRFRGDPGFIERVRKLLTLLGRQHGVRCVGLEAKHQVSLADIAERMQ